MVRCRCIVCVQEFFECEVFADAAVQLKRFVKADDGFLSKRRHNELEEWKGLPFEEIGFLNTNRLILSVFHDTTESIVDGQIFLLQNGHL